MEINDFITSEEMDDLPDDDEQAFVDFVILARKKLATFTSGLESENDSDWRILQSANHSFMNVVSAAAKQFDIAPFKVDAMPRAGNYTTDDHGQLVSLLDNYLTQRLLARSAKGRKDSVALGEAAKISIRTHLHHLRETVSKSELPEDRRTKLLEALSKFEVELEKRRVSMMDVAKITIAVLGIPGSFAGTYDISAKLLGHVVQTIASEKEAEESRHASSGTPHIGLHKTGRLISDGTK